MVLVEVGDGDEPGFLVDPCRQLGLEVGDEYFGRDLIVPQLDLERSTGRENALILSLISGACLSAGSFFNSSRTARGIRPPTSVRR